VEEKLCKALNNAHDICCLSCRGNCRTPQQFAFLELEDRGGKLQSGVSGTRRSHQAEEFRAALAEMVVRWGTKEVLRAGLKLHLIWLVFLLLHKDTVFLGVVKLVTLG